MPSECPAFLALWNDIAPERVEEYDCWHTFEHVPERVSVPGFLWARRYLASGRNENRYFTLYGVEGVGVFETPAYRELVAQPTEWSRSMRPSFANFLRIPCESLSRSGFGIGGSLATFVIETEASLSPDAPAIVQLGRDLLEQHEITAVQIGAETAGEFKPFGTQPAAPRETSLARHVLLFEGTQRSRLDAAEGFVRKSVGEQLGAGAPGQWRSYDLASVIWRSELEASSTGRRAPRPDLMKRYRTGAG